MNNKVFEILNRPKKKLERNGFDRSFRTVFSAKAGQILPCFALETVPNSYYEIDPVDFIRTTSFNESNFVRLKQHVDFFYVPFSALLRDWDNIYQQTADPYTALFPATGPIGENQNRVVPFFPLISLVVALMRADCFNKYGQSVLTDLDTWFSQQTFYSSVPSTYRGAYSMFITSNGLRKDIHGYPLHEGVCRILDLLGYGNFLPFLKVNWSNFVDASAQGDVRNFRSGVANYLQSIVNKRVNMWRLLAYQCVCENFYTNTQYVKPDVRAYNLDDCSTGTPAVMRANDDYGASVFKLNYCPWAYDLFTAALPNPQFGAVSLADVDVDKFIKTSDVATTVVTNQLHAGSDGSIRSRSDNSNTNSFPGVLRGVLDVMDLKRAEALQAWKIAIGRAGYRSSDRYESTFGSRPSHSVHIDPVRLGSIDGDVMKDVVTGTAGDEFAQTAATGTSVLNNRKITYQTSGEFGIIIGVFRVIPVAEYDSYQIDKMNTKFDPFDYFTPAFQDLGLETLSSTELSQFGLSLTGVNASLGYVPPYSEYKISVDRVHGEFCQQPYILRTDGTAAAPVGEFEHFVSTRMDLETYAGRLSQFFVDPAVLNHIFLAQVDDTQSSDQFHVNMYFETKCVQPMSVLGLPQFNN